MLVPLHAIRLVPHAPCTSYACLPPILEAGLIERVPVVDAAGTEYAFDLELTQGFYLVLVSYVCLRALRDAARAWSTKAPDEDE